jgi:DUF2075 family protein
MDTEYVYLGRDNVIVRQLLANDEVEPDATKIEVRIGCISLDTDQNPDEVTHAAGVVTMRLGSVDIDEGVHQLCIYAYDGQNPNGVLWDRLWLVVRNERGCEST